MDNMYGKEDKRNTIVIDSTNKLLLEIVKNQKSNTKNLIKIFITTIICFTVLLVSMIIGFFIYESQYETIDTQYAIEQSAESDNGGSAIVNNGGDVNYGQSNADN